MQPAAALARVVTLTRLAPEGDLHLLQVDAAPGAGVPLHRHEGFDEAYYVTKGALTLQLDGRTLVLSGPAGAVVPAGAAHAWRNAGDEPVRFVTVTAAGSIEETLEAFAALPLRDVDEAARIAERHGTTLLDAR